MATRQIEAKLVLSAIDRTGRAFNSVSGRLGAVNSRANQFNRNGRSVAQTALAVGRAATVVGLAVGAVGVSAYKKFAGDERTLTRIGITAEATREQMADIRDELFNTAKATGLQFEDMVKGLDALTASGRTLEESMALLPSVAVTAQASGAEMTDIATSADALFTSMNIGAKDMQGAFDILVAGGKAGKFELKDMAQFLPSLAPAFKALGYEGEEGLKKLIVALQTVREQTGSSSEAATAYSDVLMKMESQTVNNNFKKFGVDLRGSLAKARKEGEDILEAFKRIAVEAVDGDLSKLPQLFTDKQMLIGMRALITGAAGAEKYVKALNNADGSAMRDINVIMQDQQALIDGMATSWGRLKSNIGGAIAPVVGNVMDFLNDDMEFGEALKRGLEDEDLSWLHKQAILRFTDKEDPYVIEQAKQGGWNPKLLDPESRREGAREKVAGTAFMMPVNAPIPMPVSSVGVDEKSGNAPIPLYRESADRFIPPHQRRVGGKKVIDRFSEPAKTAGNVLSNFNESGKFIKPINQVPLTADSKTSKVLPAPPTTELRTPKALPAPSSTELGTPKAKHLPLTTELDTSRAIQALENFKAMAEMPVTTTLEIDKAPSTDASGGLRNKIDAFDSQVKLPGNVLSNFDENGKFIKPSQKTQLSTELETSNAEQALDQLSAKAERSVTAKLDLDTRAAEAKLASIEKRMANIGRGAGSGSARNKGQSMPGAR